MSLRILVVGAGAIGGLFGVRLAKAGRDVTFLVRPARQAALKQDGLTLLATEGTVRLAPQTVTAKTLAEPFDIILLSVKAFGLAQAMEDLAPAIGEASTIVPLLNGLAHIDKLRQRFGVRPVIGGVCRAVVQLDETGAIHQANPLQQINYGELDGSLSPRILALDGALQGAGLDSSLSRNIEQDLWDKWVQLATLGAATCLLGGSVGEINAQTYGREIAEAILSEAIAIASACGHAPEKGVRDANLGLVTKMGSPMTSSMYRDKAANRPVEAEQILGDLIRRGAGAGLDAPLLKAAFAGLQTYQARLDGEG